MRIRGGRKTSSVLEARIKGWREDHPKSKTKMHRPGSQQTERKFIGRSIRQYGTGNVRN